MMKKEDKIQNKKSWQKIHNLLKGNIVLMNATRDKHFFIPHRFRIYFCKFWNWSYTNRWRLQPSTSSFLGIRFLFIFMLVFVRAIFSIKLMLMMTMMLFRYKIYGKNVTVRMGILANPTPPPPKKNK